MQTEQRSYHQIEVHVPSTKFTRCVLLSAFVEEYMLRLPDVKVHKSNKECINTEEKASASGGNKLKVDVSWTREVDNSFPAIQTIATSYQCKIHHQHAMTRKLIISL